MKKTLLLLSLAFTTFANAQTDTNAFHKTGDNVNANSFIGTLNAEPLIFRVQNRYSGGISATGGGHNICMGEGSDSVVEASGGKFNTMYGSNSGGGLMTTASYNTGIGCNALDGLLTGTLNTSVGYYSLGNTDHASSGSTSNTGIGAYAGYSNNKGRYNTFLGFGAGYSTINTSSGNTILGSDASHGAAGHACKNANTVIGDSADYTGGGTGGCIVGAYAAMFNYGNYNTAIGDSTGEHLTSGSNNTLLGGKTDVGTGTITNSTAIGYGAIATASNQLVISNSITSISIPNTNPSSSTPVNPTTPSVWEILVINGTTYYIPLYQ